MPISKNNRIIASLLDWETQSGPKSKGHWVDGRSAKEVARAWLASGDQLPSEIDLALKGLSARGLRMNAMQRLLPVAATP